MDASAGTASWYPFDDGRTIGQGGSEDGIIIRDDAHSDGARITLERDTAVLAAFAITCGVYGWLVHTRYFRTADEANAAFDEMKPALEEILRLVPAEDDPDEEEKVPAVLEAVHSFMQEYPSK